ncbi:glycosyltransferase family 4 protein [Xylona heveae TC161]|uniref:Glycosyltransferase family 4 protein n=1 Tax=Xylona heveae (strain CBS 132557 / TC161) TaxID=1328760 RepID=A0A161TDX4_XYLHT|nr:glycosyltransferase family 4 protein [Xylona heveae TC161]KZF24087.1 glycosyltransferase family 4 protein [Xylona heveae TC161]
MSSRSTSGTSTPSGRKPRSLRPVALAILAFRLKHKFETRPSTDRKRRLSMAVEKEGNFSLPLEIVFAGISATLESPKTLAVAISIHDSVYSIDFSVARLDLDDTPAEFDRASIISEYIVSELRKYEREHMCKFLGVGLPDVLREMSPKLCSRLWSQLDIVPFVMHVHLDRSMQDTSEYWGIKSIDEQADSMARKCLMYFGPSRVPLLQVGFRGIVETDAGFHAQLVTLEDFQNTVGEGTWNAVMKYTKDLQKRKVKAAFFSSTPQGGGVALMRHALIRFFKTIGVDMRWYVPKPKPGVFRITKTNHNILQGVSKPDERLSEPQGAVLSNWIEENAERYWFSKGGPLRPPSEGGVDVVFIDDPQMPGLIPLIKKITPDRLVVYRSHIEIRSDLTDIKGSPQAEAWNFLWNDIKQADMFISHPVSRFVPHNVPEQMVGYLGAATDWLDGLNKNMNSWDLGYYGHAFNVECQDIHMTKLEYPARKYIVQVARFDPSKGIPQVLESYAKFRRNHLKNFDRADTPQLLLCGHGSVDDPDATWIYDQTMDSISSLYSDLANDISVMRLGPSDQMLNTLLSESYVALQLSTREGFEVKVSEALHKGKPVIATLAGGIPLQVQHEKNGYLVKVYDTDAVAQHLYDLWTNDELYEKMSKYAAHSVSDEIGTVGNALSWLYLASELSQGHKLEPNGRWINDMARETANEPYRPGENRLPRGKPSYPGRLAKQLAAV